MAIRGDSFGSVAEVVAYTRPLLNSQSTFNSTTLPTVTEVEKFIDRASGRLNVALAQAGFSPANVYANSTAKLACDDWVVFRAVEYVELTQQAAYLGTENERYQPFRDLSADAAAFANEYALGFKRLGITVSDPMHQGFTFTGMDKRSQRSDPDNTNREQPKFRRGLWENT